eukprot:gnl/Chilomastix_caulleri/4734.p1 GENE.gnl/Chilomastix_caulleri/4734~~gnl/Chilomastix_caulleri/4734.p1  ORF type:complete len:76 (+),score=17.31 gnl/Chilomastix_caulleri/4734:94-321(+)
MSEVTYDEEPSKYKVCVPDFPSEVLGWALWSCYTNDASVVGKVFFGFDTTTNTVDSNSKGGFTTPLKLDKIRRRD